MTQAEMALRALSHTDNAEPITGDWLESIWFPRSKRTDSGDNEYEAIIMVTENGEQGKETVFRKFHSPDDTSRGAEVTVFGINLDNMRPFLETWGHEVIILPPIATRLEFRLLLVSLKAWGYTGR